MGQLTDLGFATETVKTPKGELTLRGLSLDDVLRIARTHGQSFKAIFEMIVGENAEISLENTGVLAGQLVEFAPDIVADVIAAANDQPDKGHIAKKLSFPIQIEALEKVGKLTFASEADVKKLVSVVTEMAMATTKTVQALAPGARQ